MWLNEHGAVPGTTAADAAHQALRRLRTTYGLDEKAFAASQLTDVHDVGNGPIIARFDQTVNGIPIFHAQLKVALRRDLRPISASGTLARSIDGAEIPYALSARAALARAGVDLSSVRSVPAQAGYERFDAPSFQYPARVKKVFFPLAGVRLVPAYYAEVVLRDGAARGLIIDGLDGTIRLDANLRRDAEFTYRAFADPQTLLPADGPQGNAAEPIPTGTPMTYRPTLGASSTVKLSAYPFSRMEPWLPEGATATSGNNVDAYSDVAMPDGFSASTADTRGLVTSPDAFDYAYDHTQQPGGTAINTQASIVHLFYVMNFMHDWFYDAGFDEAHGNHQGDNFGRGGQAGDALHAEALDYSGKNNSNAYTPGDGQSAVVQMFVFSGTGDASLAITAPAEIAGVRTVGIGGFGTDTFDLTGQVGLAIDDQGGDLSDACEAVSNNLAGKIALVHRGLCSFVQKAQNAQAAGAVGVIIANVASSDAPTTAPYMGGTSNEITVPVLSLNLADGQAIEGAITAGVTVEMKRTIEIDLDGALDTSIVAHEWGHTLSNRLIGDGSGLVTNQAGGLGEGWSDFVALLLTAREEDTQGTGNETWQGVYPLAAYAALGGGTSFYFGIRRVPYSVDFTKDPLTFKHIQDGVALPSDVPSSFGGDGSFNSEVHSTGEVWASMLWECYVGLLRDPRYDFATAQSRMKRYLVASLELTPPEPTLLDARDAVLAAALATDTQDFQTFWQAFARRGAGVGATGPTFDSSNNGPVSESFSVNDDVQIVSATLSDDGVSCDHDGMIDEGERGSVAITLRNDGSSSLPETSVLLSTNSTGLVFDNSGVAKVPPLLPFESTTLKVPVRGLHTTAAERTSIFVTAGNLLKGRLSQKELPTRVAADEAPGSSTKDTVDTNGTSWEVFGFEGPQWSRVQTPSEGYWMVPNSAFVSSHELVSAAFEIDGTTFSLAFKHRWSFRRSMRRMTDVDGGVVEISLDGGINWEDLSTYGTVDYNTTLDASRTTNALAGRQAYGNTSLGYPDAWVQSKVDVKLPAHPDQVKVRFLMGTAGGFAGAPGWNVDDITLEGIASKPFWSFVPQRDACDPQAPTANAGPAQAKKSGDAVTLAGSGSIATGAALHFSWDQVAGPPVRLVDADTAVPHFVASQVETSTPITLALRVDDGALLSVPSQVVVTVSPAGGCAVSGKGKGSWTSLILVLLALIGATRRRRARAA